MHSRLLYFFLKTFQEFLIYSIFNLGYYLETVQDFFSYGSLSNYFHGIYCYFLYGIYCYGYYI